MASPVTTHGSFVLQKRTVTAQGAEQDEGAEGVNFNLIKLVWLLISYGNICYGGTMTL